MPPHNPISQPAKAGKRPATSVHGGRTRPKPKATPAAKKVVRKPKPGRPMDQIISLPNPQLQKKSKRITKIDANVEALAADMIAAVLDWESTRPHEFGAALSAIQIGKEARMIVVRNSLDDREDQSFGVFINPEIYKTDGRPTESMEGCLSIPDIYGRVPRYPRVKMKAINLQGEEIRLSASGFLARVLQHEIDHLDGILFTDRITDINKLYRLGEDGQFIKYQPPSL